MLKTPTLIAGFDDVTVMCQPVEKRGRHLGVTENLRPFAEVQIGCDHD